MHGVFRLSDSEMFEISISVIFRTEMGAHRDLGLRELSRDQMRLGHALTDLEK